MDHPFPILGLSGGIASGKTHVARLLEARGWALLDADQAARAVVAPGTEGLAAVIGAFGADMLAPDGSLDRARLGARIFADERGRTCLEGILHPRIEAFLEAQIAALPATTRGAVLDAALWLERGKAHHFDAFWVVDAPKETRIQRMMARDGIGREAAQSRLAAQSKAPEKALHADVALQNDGRDLAESIERAERALLADWRVRRSRTWRSPMPAPFQPQELHPVLENLLSKGGDYG
jgi:dephospho-CoA kinase